MMYMVVWNKGDWANVSGAGEVLEASGQAAQAEVEARLAEPVLRWAEAGDYLQTLQPGTSAHLEEVLRQLPGAVVTTDG